MEMSVAPVMNKEKVVKERTFDLKGSESIVHYVVNEYCDGHPSELARRLTFSGRRVVVSRQVVDSWLSRKQFPREWIVTVHNMFKVPLKPLIGEYDS